MIAWRYFVPRPGYFKALKIAAACPEIRIHMDRIALYSAGYYFVTAILVTGFAAVYPIIFLAEKGRRFLGFLPDFAEKRFEALHEAHAILPVEEIRRRIGLPPEHGVILRKPDFRADDDGTEGSIG